MTNIQNELWAIAGLQNLEVETGEGVTVVVETTPALTPEQQVSVVIENELNDEKPELVEITKEGEELVVAIDKQNETIETIQNNIDGLEAMFSQGSYCSSLASLVYGQTLELHAKLGGNNDRYVLGGEAFADGTSAQLAMQAGLEGMMETIKKYASNVVEFIKKIWDKIITFFKFIFDRANKIKARAISYKKRLNDGESIKTTIKGGKWNNSFDLDKNGTGWLKSPSIELFFTTFRDIGSLSGEFRAKLLPNVKTPTADFLKTVDSVNDDIRKTVTQKFSQLGKAYKGVSGFVTKVTETLGIMNYTVKFLDKTITSVDVAKKAFDTFRISTSMEKEAYKGEIKSQYDKSKLISFCDEVIKSVDALQRAKTKFKASESDRDKELSTIKSSLEKGDKYTKVNIGIVQAAYNSFASISLFTINSMLTMNDHTLDLVKAHFGKTSESKETEK